MEPPTYWPFVVYTGVVLAVAAGMLFLSHFLGERHRERCTAEPYESGVPPTGSGRTRFSIKFFLIAILFVIFDLELAFIFAWATAVLELGWSGFTGALVFILILAVGLVYEWRMGSLDWTSSAHLRRPRMPAYMKTGAQDNSPATQSSDPPTP
ncbi:MAG: NADH-quinone oxidoreductase subunit A [Opitutales bacterium]|nr:NADH-quinone oxidoreductase subunit A [Opitutales bacterium]